MLNKHYELYTRPLTSGIPVFLGQSWVVKELSKRLLSSPQRASVGTWRQVGAWYVVTVHGTDDLWLSQAGPQCFTKTCIPESLTSRGPVIPKPPHSSFEAGDSAV